MSTYIAVCLVCTPRLPMPFSSAEERGHWIREHHQATAHAVWAPPEDPVDVPWGRIAQEGDR